MVSDYPVIHKKLVKKSYTVHYYVSGSPDSETIVFLHPAFSDHQCFSKQINFFSAKYKVITIDMLGHGLTGNSNSFDTITSTPVHILEILQAENSPNAHIVGVSLGALLAQLFAFIYPKRTLSLTAIGGYNIHRKQKEIVKTQQKEMFKWIFKMIYSMDAFRRHVASVSVVSKEAQESFYQSAKSFTRKSFQMMSGVNRIVEDRNIERTYPLMIVVGEKENEDAMKANLDWHKSEVSSQMQVIKNAGHCANMDNHTEFNEVLLNFISSKQKNIS